MVGNGGKSPSLVAPAAITTSTEEMYVIAETKSWMADLRPWQFTLVGSSIAWVGL